MHWIALDRRLAERLQELSGVRAGTPAGEAVEALWEYVEDVNDVRVAEEHLRNPGKTYSAEEVKRMLGIE